MELKNDLVIHGRLQSVDQFHNLNLDNIKVDDVGRFPHLRAVKTLFIRGSVIRYVHIPSEAVDIPLLEDAARREACAHSGNPIASS